MNKQIFERLRTLDSTPNQNLVNSYNSHFVRKDKDKNLKLIFNEKVRPCFFSGDIEAKEKIVTISLNPKYTKRITEEEQSEMSFVEWYEFCRFRFKNYDSDSSVHLTFRNLFKIVAPPKLWRTIDKRDYLQKNIVNLDWCFYYSENFPTFDLNKLPERLQHNIYENWDKNLEWLIKKTIPRYIFAHGKSIKNWVERNSDKIKQVIQLKSSRKHDCCLLKGKFLNTDIPIYYLEHSVNNVNKNTTLEQINYFINNSESSRKSIL